jgi:hypothetical protein
MRQNAVVVQVIMAVHDCRHTRIVCHRCGPSRAEGSVGGARLEPRALAQLLHGEVDTVVVHLTTRHAG